ncbi:MAG: hypothetical protein U0X76_05765 [Bacteroidia bacterium]
MSNRRRFIIAFLSVAAGSLISLYIVKKRMGTLSRDAYMQLGMNFFFAVAIVVGIGILLSKVNKNDDERK